MASIISKLPFAKKPQQANTSPTATPEANENNDKEMTIFDHLRELRDRLIICVAAVIVTTGISFFFAEKIIRFFLIPSGIDTLIVLHPTENFSTYLQVAFLSGFILALPIVSWQIIAFISPGLYPSEKRALLMLLPGITLCFLAGASFSYFLMLPAALGFLRHFGTDVFTIDWRANDYLDLVTQLIFWTGIVFETPLLMFVLAKLRIVRREQLGKYRKYAFLIAFILGAVITPTPDPFNMTVVALPIYFLYEIGVFLTRFA